MKIKLLSAILLLAFVAITSSCRRDTVVADNLSYMPFESQCLGTSLDGNVRIKAWGSGATRGDAIENAKRNALRDVIFNGVKLGNPACQRPLTYEVNAHERHEMYFNRFFADGGEYTQYATLEDETLTSRTKAKGDVQQNYGVVVTVKRANLQQKLINDGIINPYNY